MAMNGNGVWRSLALMALTALLTLGASTAALSGKIDAAQAKEICDERIAPIKAGVQEIKEQVKEIDTRQRALERQTTSIGTKIDTILESLRVQPD